MRCKGWTLLRLAFFLALLALCAPRSEAADFYSFQHSAMGTEFSVVLVAENKQRASEIADIAFAEVDSIEQLLSNYRESSELSRINRQAAHRPITVDPETFRFLEESQHWSEVSDGAFDITVGPLMRAWGFFEHHGHIPSAEVLRRAKSDVGWQKVKLNAVDRTVRFTHEDVELDPGGIGKGFAVDAVVRLLREQGVRSALISAGSSTIYAIGAPTGERGWKVVVRSPLVNKPVLSTIYLRDMSLSSTNCSEKNFIVHGVVYCHIMDPRSGWPVRGRVHVTVLHPSATASDALSNVLFVERPDVAKAVLEKSVPEAKALILYRDKGLRCMTFRWETPCGLR